MERWFISLVEHKEYLYWITEIGCHFMKMNLLNNKIEYLRPQMDVSVEGKGRAAILCSWNDILIYTVERGEGILLYDLEKNTVKTIRINCSDMNLNMFSYARVVNNILIIIPMYHYEMVEINLETGKYCRKDWLELKGNSSVFRQYFTHNAFEHNDELEVISSTTNEMVKIQLKTFSVISRRKLTHNETNIVNYEYVDGCIIYLNVANELHVIKNGNDRILLKISNVSEGYLTMHRVKSDIWVMPLFDEEILCYSFNRSIKMNRIKLNNSIYTAPKTMGKFFGKCSVNDKTFFSMHAGTQLLCVDNQFSKLSICKVEWPCNEDDIYELKYQKRQIMQENTIPLDTFINYVCCEN